MHARKRQYVQRQSHLPLTHLESGPKPATPVRHDVLRFIVGHLPHNVEGACPLVRKIQALVCLRSVLFNQDQETVNLCSVGGQLRGVGLRGMRCVSQVDIRNEGMFYFSTILYNGNQIRGSIRDPSNKGTQFDCDLHSRTSHFESISDKYAFLTPL